MNMNEQKYNEAMHLARIYDGDVKLVLPERMIPERRAREILEAIVVTLNHTINQPLCSIVGYPDMIKMGVDAQISDNLLGEIKNAGLSIKAILNQVSDYLKNPLGNINTKPYVDGNLARLLDIDFE